MTVGASQLVHPSAVLEGDVELAAGVRIGPHAVVLGPCRLGAGVRIGPGCVIGTAPEIGSLPQADATDGHEWRHGVVIGERSVLRELTTVQQGSHRPTEIGADCYLLTRSYVAHDGRLGDGVTLSAGTALGGHVMVGDRATLGMNATVHQGRQIGGGCMIGMSAVVTRDVPPWAKAMGIPARVVGANSVGMSRRGIAEEDVAVLAEAYRSGLPVAIDALSDHGLQSDLHDWASRGRS